MDESAVRKWRRVCLPSSGHYLSDPQVTRSAPQVTYGPQVPHQHPTGDSQVAQQGPTSDPQVAHQHPISNPQVPTSETSAPQKGLRRDTSAPHKCHTSGTAGTHKWCGGAPEGAQKGPTFNAIFFLQKIGIAALYVLLLSEVMVGDLANFHTKQFNYF